MTSILTTLRAIARVGCRAAATQELSAAAGWHREDGSADQGFLLYQVPLPIREHAHRPLWVLTAEGHDRPAAFFPLDYYDERDSFDAAFHAIRAQLVSILGPPSRSGAYDYAHRPAWSYSFVGWSLADATLILIQDEFDIQFGWDVTLWVQPAGTAIAVPIRLEG